MLAPYFSRVLVRGGDSRYPRGQVRIKLGSVKMAQDFLERVVGKLGRREGGTVVAEGWAAVVLAERLGWPERVVRALERLWRLAGRRGLAMDLQRIQDRQEAAVLLEEAVRRALGLWRRRRDLVGPLLRDAKDPRQELALFRQLAADPGAAAAAGVQAEDLLMGISQGEPQVDAEDGLHEA